MILKLKKGTGVQAFLNKEIFYVDVKSVKLDRVLTVLRYQWLSVKNILLTF